MCVLTWNVSLATAQQQASDPKHCDPWKDIRSTPRQVFTDLYATLVPAGDSADAPAMYLATLLQELRLVFIAPDTLADLSEGSLAMWLHADGSLTNLRPADPRVAPQIVYAFRAAVDSLARRGGLGPVVPQLQADSVDLRLNVHYANRRTPLSMPLLRVAHPAAYFEFQVEKPAMPRVGNPAPRYPTVLRESNIEGEVLAQFVVDRSGRAEIRTLKILKSSHVDFSMAVREVLPRMRFYPAEVGGCTVRQVVQLPFAFRLSR